MSVFNDSHFPGHTNIAEAHLVGNVRPPFFYFIRFIFFFARLSHGDGYLLLLLAFFFPLFLPALNKQNKNKRRRQ